MRKIFLILLIPIFFSSFVSSAFEFKKQTKISANYDSEGKFHPDLFLPIYWQPNIFSAFEYRTTFNKKSGKVDLDGVSDSNTETKTDYTVKRLHLLQYSAKNFAFDIGYGIETYNEVEEGYFVINNNSLGAVNTTFINKTDIEYSSVFGKLVYTNDSNLLAFRLGALVLLSPNLKVTQDTDYSGIFADANLITDSRGSSSETTDPMYELTLNTKSNSKTPLDVGFNVLYQKLPVKYSLILSDGTESNIDQTHTLTEYIFLLYYNSPFFGLTPNIGYKSSSTELKDNSGGGTESESNSAIVFGIDNKF